MGELTDRHVVVTGGAGALGVAVVQALVEAGAVCHVPSRGGRAPAELAAAGARVRVVAGVDLADEASVVAFYAGLPDLWASIHVAGGFAAAPLADTSLADLRAQLDQNAVTCFLCCREAVKAMRARAHGGRIVNVASRAAAVPGPGMAAYSVSKAAVAWLTRCLAAELVADQITVNAVLPSIIDTPANRQSMPTADFSKWPKPSEIAATIKFLASPESVLTSGALIPVYGSA